MDKSFADIIQRMVQEQSTEVLVNGEAKKYLADYCEGQFKNELDIFRRILDIDCGKHISNADDIPELKQKLLTRLEDEKGLSPKVTAEYLDLLGLILKGDTSTCGGGTASDASAAVSSVPASAAVRVTAAAPGVEPLMKRSHLFLEDSDWQQASGYFDRVLDMDPEYAPAYIGKLCTELKLQQEGQLAQNGKPLTEYRDYQKAVRFATGDYRTQIEGYNNAIQERIAEENRKDQERIAEENRREQEHIAEENRREQERIAKENRKDQERLEEARRILPPIRKRIAKFQRCVSILDRTIFGLKMDGTVLVTKLYYNTQGWRNIVAVISSCSNTVGLKADGTVIAVGSNKTYKLGKDVYTGQCDTQGWWDIVAVCIGSYHTVGLKADGTVVAVGDNEWGQCNTQGWQDIVGITSGDRHTVGLKADGTVVAVGYNEWGQCNTQGWQDIVGVTSSGSWYTVGLKEDGTVVAVGDNREGQCNTQSWRDIVAVCIRSDHTVGLKADGTVVTTGRNGCNTQEWRDIVAVSNFSHIVGLKADGTVVAVGNNDWGQCNTQEWRDIVAVWAGVSCTVALKADGTVVAVGNVECNTQDWRDIGPVPEDKLSQMRQEEQQRLEEQRRIEQSNKWVSQGLCQYCGGQLGGIFTKKCKSCGKVN